MMVMKLFDCLLSFAGHGIHALGINFYYERLKLIERGDVKSADLSQEFLRYGGKVRRFLFFPRNCLRVANFFVVNVILGRLREFVRGDMSPPTTVGLVESFYGFRLKRVFQSI